MKTIALGSVTDLATAMTTAIENNCTKGQGSFNFFLTTGAGGYCVQGYYTPTTASGIITQQAMTNAWQFYHSAGGADTVLKKLGSGDIEWATLVFSHVNWESDYYGKYSHRYSFNVNGQIPNFGNMVHCQDFFIVITSYTSNQEGITGLMVYNNHDNNYLYMRSNNAVNTMAVTIYYNKNFSA